MVNYADGKIYKLVNNVDNKIYVGSTCNPLRLRKSGHKIKSSQKPDMIVYRHLNQIGWGNVDIILIENFGCNNKDELTRRERYWIETLQPELNKCIPTQTPKEWYEKNKEHVLQKTKKYAEEHKENVIKYKKKYVENNKEKIYEKMICECGVEIHKKHKSTHVKTKRHENLCKIKIL